MPDDFYFTCQHTRSNAALGAPFDPDDGPTPSMGDDSTVLTSIGLIFDSGLCADGVPPDQWADYAAGAVDVADVYLATCTLDEWESPQAAEVVAVTSAVGGLLYEICDRGAALFHSLSDEDRNRLLRASKLIEGVSRP